MQNLPVIVEIDHEQDKVLTVEDIEEALNYYYGAYSTVKVSAAEHRMHQTAFGVLALVFFLGFGIGAVVFNGLCGGW